MTNDLDPITPESALSYYLDARQYDLSDDTLRSHRYRIESFIRWLQSPEYGDGEVLNMNDVDLRTVHAYRVFKREENFEGDEPCNAVTMQGQVSTLRVFFQYIADIDAVPEELADRIRLPRLQHGEDVSESVLDSERANAILDYLHKWEYASSEHVAFLILWRTSCRLGGLRALDVSDFDREERALCFRHRPKTDTGLKNGARGERDVSLKPRVAAVIEDYIDGPHRHRVTDEFGRSPLVTTVKGRPSPTTIRLWCYKWSRPCAIGEVCPDGRDLDECEATSHNAASKCPFSVSSHPVRAGSITAFRDAGAPREVVSDRGDVSEKILEKHYDRASSRQRMRRRQEFIPDNL
ncbi:site-specific integrase [Haloferax larsenii]|uniref:Site-specific integrase n=1 Tax=Haloferax larsenii TaxID=302484 RepID=A0ABY5REY0_HALLR|nr:site-specific integrase [Haloferax larsenii]UVE50590.1 site-specific integrase [Haloferax larsenii]